MTLQASGAISLSQVNTELSLAASALISLNASNVRTLAGVASGLISFSNLYGKSNGPLGRGYFAGGNNGSNYSEIDGLQFDNESAINPAAGLTIARYALTGVNSSTRGYFGGGSDIGYSNVNRIDTILFSNETVSISSALLSLVCYGMGGVNSTVRGYFAGGYIASGGGSTIGWSPVSGIDGVVFSSDTAFNSGASLVFQTEGLTGASSSSKGYFAGGQVGGTKLAEISGVNFATDAAINPAAALAQARYDLAGLNSSTRGYFAGGFANSGYNVNEIDGIDFNTEAAINPAAALVSARTGLAGVNSSTRGYFGGGETSGALSEIDGIQFDTEAAINPAASLVASRYLLTGVQSGGSL